MMRTTVVAGLVASFFAWGPAAFAQGTSVTLTGIVRDAAGRVLPGAAVVIDPDDNPIATRTSTDGRFRIERIQRGRHRLRVSWIGYSPDERDIDLNESAVSVEIVLEPLAYQLDTLDIIARRGGIIGRALTRVGLAPVNGVSIEVLGTRWRLRTGEDGRFEFPEIPEGGYVVQVRRDGYKTRTISAAVPPSGAVEVVAALDSIASDRDKRFENRLRDMEGRLHRRTVNTSAIIARQELLIRPGILLDEALRYAPSGIGKGLILLSAFVCVIYVDGVEDRFARLKDFRAEDVSMIEVYSASGCAEDVPGKPGVRVIRPTGKPGYVVYVWLKR
jgi:Carboxypeptidase regulatory-like domain